MVRGVARLRLLERRPALDAESSAVGREVENLTEAFDRMGYGEALAQKPHEVKARQAHAAAGRAALLVRPAGTTEIPPVEALKAGAGELPAGADLRDPAFGRTLSALLSSVGLFAARLIGGGKVELRARLTVAIAPLADTGRGGTPLLLDFPTVC